MPTILHLHYDVLARRGTAVKVIDDAPCREYSPNGPPCPETSGLQCDAHPTAVR